MTTVTSSANIGRSLRSIKWVRISYHPASVEASPPAAVEIFGRADRNLREFSAEPICFATFALRRQSSVGLDETIRTFRSLQKGSMHHRTELPLVKRPAGRADSSAAKPLVVPHPLDSDWRLTRPTVGLLWEIIAELASSHSGVALLGTPWSASVRGLAAGTDGVVVADPP